MRLLLCSLLLTLGLTACGGAGGEVTYSGDVWPLIESRCSACHDAAGQEYYNSNVLFVDAASTYDVLLNGDVSADTVGGFTKYVVPGDAANSSLFDKIANDPPDSGGNVMPGSGMMLSESDIDVIGSWINGGALNN
ncbi:MAG: hypothetical protein HOI23_05065 [Deltaproteobacteria bacterium]|nr:hypothetical protein [Deltaproteobacteria bacterium]MBT6433180.1 hypothetical protein [Deltaproteobacteria bacterium]MBT6492741.1 hypothetical protein [Deltaproteobacteria bacterium]